MSEQPALDEVLHSYETGDLTSYGLYKSLVDRTYLSGPPPVGFLTEDDVTTDGIPVPPPGTWAEVEYACRAGRIEDYIFNAAYRSKAREIGGSLNAKPLPGQRLGPKDLRLLGFNEISPADLMTDAEYEAEIADSEQHAKHGTSNIETGTRLHIPPHFPATPS